MLKDTEKKLHDRGKKVKNPVIRFLNASVRALERFVRLSSIALSRNSTRQFCRRILLYNITFLLCENDTNNSNYRYCPLGYRPSLNMPNRSERQVDGLDLCSYLFFI